MARHSAALSFRPIQPTLGLIAVLLALAAGPGPARGQTIEQIDQSRGADSRVDYRSLARIGPWDDRNYRLTGADLSLLAPNEAELSDPIPVFFRVEMRRAWPELRRSGPAQYPRSALQIFRQLYTGYQIGGQFYRKVVREGGVFRVLLDESSRIVPPAARFLSGEVRVSSPTGAAESAIKIHPLDPDRIVAGSNGPGSGQVMHYSEDGGASWQAVSLPLGGTCCDPTVDWKSDGSLAYAATLGSCGNSGCGVWFYRSSDGGKSWSDLGTVTPGDPRREITSSGSDKEYLHVDKAATSPHRDSVYLTWHDNNVLKFARSTDDGHSWSTVSFSADPLGIGSDITTDRNGHVYYVWPAFDTRQIVLKKSTNGGASFAGGVVVIASTHASFAFPVPSMDTREAFIYVAADSDLGTGPYANSLYVAWTDSTAATGSNAAGNHARIQVARSRDGGATWSVVTPHETSDQNSVDRYHPWLAVGPDGRVHVAFYDTRRSASRTSVDLYYTVSVDGAQTFSPPLRLTAQQSPKIDDSFEFGDYNGLDAVMSDVIAIFTDNRNESGGGGDSVDVYAAGRSEGDRPEVTILAPTSGAQVASGSAVSFVGTASDAQDGDLTASLSWTSSLDGPIGSGGSFSQVLSDGSHTVTASVSDSGGLAGSAAIEIAVGCVGYTESFEDVTSDWTTSGLWHLVDDSACASPGYASPTRAMYFGQDASCNYDTGGTASGDLVSPAIPGVVSSSALRFAFFRQVESTTNDAYETVSVAAAVDGTSSWQTLWSRTSLDASLAAWTSSDDLSLAAFAGQRIRLRFRFDSGDEIENDFVGWLVDDVEVTGACSGPGPGLDVIFIDGFESGDVSAWSSVEPP